MFKKLCILLIYSILEMVKPLIYHQYMHNLYTIFSKILKICKQFGDNLINEKGNIPRPGVVPKFSDIEVIALNLTSEAMGIDSESNLFIRLSEYKDKMPNLISRRLSLYWRLEIRLGILSLYSESLMKRLLSLSIPMASDVRFKAITSISENLGTTPGRGIFPFSFMRLSPNCLQILRILLNIVYKLCIY